jgi:hypothetical protein
MTEDIFSGNYQGPLYARHPDLTHEEMLEEAEHREAERKALDALDKLHEENGDAMKKLAEIETREHKTIDEMTRQERVDAAIDEIWWLVQGGQDGREYANSILFIVKVLESLK